MRCMRCKSRDVNMYYVFDVEIKRNRTNETKLRRLYHCNEPTSFRAHAATGFTGAGCRGRNLGRRTRICDSNGAYQ